jgi:hypothetical protein
MNDLNSVHEFINELRRQHREEGFEELDPKEVQKELNFGYRPDLLFRRGNEVTVIEIKKPTSPIPADHLRQLKSKIESKPGWHFRFFVVPNRQVEIERIDALPQANTTFAMSKSFSNTYPSIAAVTLWMSLETAMRHLLTLRKERPSAETSGIAMARRLRDLGELDDDDVRRISELYELRSHAIHGYQVDKTPGKEVQELTERLLKDAGIFQKTLTDQEFVQR